MRGLLRELATVGGLDAIGAAKHATGKPCVFYWPTTPAASAQQMNPS